MNVKVKRFTEWSSVLDSARTTVGKDSLNKEPSEEFKKAILIAEHSPIRALQFEVIWEDIPYYVAMHLRTHSIGFMSGEDDLYFVQTQRTDRTQKERDKLPQDALVRLRVIINAHSIINVSRVRLCKLADSQTRKAWVEFIIKLSEIEPLFASLAVPNCVYRKFCPETVKSCGYNKTDIFKEELSFYRKMIKKENFKG